MAKNGEQRRRVSIQVFLMSNVPLLFVCSSLLWFAVCCGLWGGFHEVGRYGASIGGCTGGSTGAPLSRS